MFFDRPVCSVEFLIALIDVLEPCHDLCKLIVSTLEPKALEFMFHHNSYKLVLRCIAKLKNGLNKVRFNSMSLNTTSSGFSSANIFPLYSVLSFAAVGGGNKKLPKTSET